VLDLSPENIIALYRKHGYVPARGSVGREDCAVKACCPIGILYVDAYGAIPNSDDVYTWFRFETDEEPDNFWKPFDIAGITDVTEIGQKALVLRKALTEEFGFIPSILDLLKP
jgi:hypothetical protein